MSKVVLFLNQDALSAYRWSERGALPLAFFPHDELGITDFREWILRHPNVSYFILTDLVEEDLQYELVPHLSGRDQKALLNRKLDQYFRATPYRRAKVQIAGKRGGQDVLQLSALTSRDVLDRVLSDLAVVKAPIAGIYSVALLTQEMIKRLKLDTPHLMVMSCNSPGQLRQSYFTRTGLRFSRLGTFHAKQMSSQAEMIAREVIRARQYLSTLRLMGREELLHIWALFDTSLAQMHSEIMLALGDEAEQVHFQVQTDMAELANRLKLPKGCQSWHDVMVAMLVTFHIPNQYAPSEAIKYHQLNLLGRGLSISAIFILVLAIILAILTFFQGLQLQEQVEIGAKRQLHAQQQFRHYTALLHQSSASSPEQLQHSVELYQDHFLPAPQPEPTLRRLSQTLQQFPTLTLDQIQWQTGMEFKARSANASEPIPADNPRPWLEQVLVLTGRVQNREAYRAALAQVGQLQAALKSWPDAQVQVLQWPVDIRSDASIKPLVDSASTRGRADFVLELRLAAPKKVTP